MSTLTWWKVGWILHEQIESVIPTLYEYLYIFFKSTSLSISIDRSIYLLFLFQCPTHKDYRVNNPQPQKLPVYSHGTKTNGSYSLLRIPTASAQCFVSVSLSPPSPDSAAHPIFTVTPKVSNPPTRCSSLFTLSFVHIVVLSSLRLHKLERRLPNNDLSSLTDNTESKGQKFSCLNYWHLLTCFPTINTILRRTGSPIANRLTVLAD